jgi:type II secretory pathway component PulF
VFFLVGFVIPKFARMYEQKNLELPIFTIILVAVGDSIQNYWYLYLAVIISAVFGIRTAWRKPKGRWIIEKMLHKVPFLDSILIGLSVARFARVFGLCLNSGLSLIDALQMGGKASGRPMLMRDVETMVDQVRTGGRLSNVLLVCHYIPASPSACSPRAKSPRSSRACAT